MASVICRDSDVERGRKDKYATLHHMMFALLLETKCKPVNNMSIAVPHRGVSDAARHPKNNIIQPEVSRACINLSSVK